MCKGKPQKCMTAARRIFLQTACTLTGSGGCDAVLPQIPIPGYASLLCQNQNQRQLSQANSFSAPLYTNSAIRVTPT